MADAPWNTPDLSDAHPQAEAAEPILRSFGGRCRFSGPIVTVKVHEDNLLVRSALEAPGGGRVLVVDGGGLRSSALVGGNLAALAARNGWAGILVHGCVRDVAELREADIGILALAPHPRRSHRRGAGTRDGNVRFAGVNFRTGDHLYADEDGVLVSAEPLAP